MVFVMAQINLIRRCFQMLQVEVQTEDVQRSCTPEYNLILYFFFKTLLLFGSSSRFFFAHNTND